MSGNSNRLSRFWQELKRRKVIRTMAMYAATAYIIIEAGDIILPRLGMPDWTVTFLIILLIAGFPIIIILSWIFDLTPQGIRRTDEVDSEEGGKVREKQLEDQNKELGDLIKERDDSDKKQEDMGKEGGEPEVAPVRKLKASDVVIAVLVVIVCILLYPKIFNKHVVKVRPDDKGRISIAVMPFQNMTKDTLWNIWQAGIQNDLITNLSNSEELSVRSFETVNNLLGRSRQNNYASLTFSKAGDISRRLDANTFIQGSIKSAGGKVRVNAHLIDSKTEEIYKTFQIDGHGEEDIFIITDSLANLVRDYLEIRELEKQVYKEYRNLNTTSSPEAYKYFILGMDFFGVKVDWASSIEMFNMALDIDSMFSMALLQKAFACHNLGESRRDPEALERSREAMQRLLGRLDELPFAMQQNVRYLKSRFDKDPFAGIKYMNLILEDDPQSFWWWQLGMDYYRVGQRQKALECLEKMLELNRKWGGQEGWPFLYTLPGHIYHELGNHWREKEIYEYGLSLNPDDPFIFYNQAVCSLSQGDNTSSTELLNRYRSINEARGNNADQIDIQMGRIYRDAERFGEALGIFRELLDKDPDNFQAKYEIASILIRQETDLEEGMGLVEELLDADPGDWDVMYLKGLGLYKQGKIGEAHQVLSASWELRPFYDHEHYQLLVKTG